MSALHALTREILDRLSTVLGGPCGLHEPEFDDLAGRFVQETLDSGWVSSVGRFVDQFEGDLRGFTGSPYAVAVVNGTAALHAALTASGVGPGDEILLPPLTFVATANAIAHAGAVPHFVDVEPGTFGINPERLAKRLEAIGETSNGQLHNRQTGRRIAGVMAVHVFGNPCQIEHLGLVCSRFGLPLYEDSAEALGSRRGGQHAGTFGRFGVLSFNGNKIITTGGGGAVLTADAEFAALVRHITTTGKKPHRWAYVHDRSAFNYRLPNLNAALGCAQMMSLPRFLAEKARLARSYATAFEGLDGALIGSDPAGCDCNHWLNNLILAPEFAFLRDEILDATNDLGIQTRPVWTLLHRLEMFREAPRDDLTVAADLEQRIISLPSSARLGREGD